jgi:hypothetical protein
MQCHPGSVVPDERSATVGSRRFVPGDKLLCVGDLLRGWGEHAVDDVDVRRIKGRTGMKPEMLRAFDIGSGQFRVTEVGRQDRVDGRWPSIHRRGRRAPSGLQQNLSGVFARFRSSVAVHFANLRYSLSIFRAPCAVRRARRLTANFPSIRNMRRS